MIIFIVAAKLNKRPSSFHKRSNDDVSHAGCLELYNSFSIHVNAGPHLDKARIECVSFFNPDGHDTSIVSHDSLKLDTFNNIPFMRLSSLLCCVSNAPVPSDEVDNTKVAVRAAIAII